MILPILEQDKPGFDLRTFVCPMCAATAFGAGVSPRRSRSDLTRQIGISRLKEAISAQGRSQGRKSFDEPSVRLCVLSRS
jgi:hypothetical protein